MLVGTGIISKLWYRFKKVKYGNENEFRGIPHIYVAEGGELIIGNGCSINSGIKHNPIGGDSKCIFRVWKDAKLTIDDGTGISNSCIVCSKDVSIGKNVLIGGNCKIYDTDFHSTDSKLRMVEDDKGISKSISIGNNAFIGAHSIILKGTIIGDNSVIGAGSVVSGIIPPNQVWAGNPAVFIKNIG